MALKDNTRSQRITKHREELQREGFARLDLFVPQDIKSLLGEIGKANNLSTAKTASLLLEHAARQYELNKAQPLPVIDFHAAAARGALRSTTVGAQSATGALPSSASAGLTGVFGAGELEQVYSQAVAPKTLSALKSQKEIQTGKSWDIPKPNAVALGYETPDKQPDDTSATVTKNPLQDFFNKRKEKS